MSASSWCQLVVGLRLLALLPHTGARTMDSAAVLDLLNEDTDSVISMYSGDNDSLASYSSESRELIEELNEQHLQDSSTPEKVSRIMPLLS